MNGFWITLENSGGTLDRRWATTEEDAQRVSVQMIVEMGGMLVGDRLTVIEGWNDQTEEDEDFNRLRRRWSYL